MDHKIMENLKRIWKKIRRMEKRIDELEEKTGTSRSGTIIWLTT